LKKLLVHGDGIDSCESGGLSQEIFVEKVVINAGFSSQAENK
jgi:hypothetical protein